MHHFKKKYSLLVIIFMVIASAAFIYIHKHRTDKKGYADFHCYYVAGQRILNHENIYVIKDATAAEFRYTPIFAVLMSTLALMDESSADTTWYIINLFLLAVSFILLKKQTIPQKLDLKKSRILYALIFLGLARFIIHNLDAGQPNIMILCSIILGLYYINRNKEGRGGAIFAISIMIKYTPLVFIPYFLLRKRYKLCFIILGSIIFYLLLPSLIIGLRTNLFYIQNMFSYLTHSSILEKMTVLDPKNQSLYSLCHRLFTDCVLYFHAPPMPFASLNMSENTLNQIFAFTALIIYLAALYNPKRNRLYDNTPFYQNITYAQLLICVVLFNLNAWMHNYILLSMAYFITTYYLIKVNFNDKTVWVLLIFSFILNIITLEPILGKTLAYKMHFYSPYTFSAFAAFLALLKIKYSKNIGFLIKP